MNDFELLYLGESLEAYIDIAQTGDWESSAIASESTDRLDSDLIILSEKQLDSFKNLSLSKTLTSYKRGLDLFQPFSFFLNFNQRKILLGRSFKNNERELRRFNTSDKLSNEMLKNLLSNCFRAIFWNKVDYDKEHLMQPYYFANRKEVLSYFKDSFCQNNGTYIMGDINEISFKKPQAVTFDSLWGKCLVQDFKINSYSRLEGLREFEFKTAYPCYNRTRLEMNLSEEINFIPNIYLDYSLKNQWIPFGFFFTQGKRVILDLYSLENGTTKQTYREKIAKAFLAMVNRSLNLPFDSQSQPEFSHYTHYSREAEAEAERQLAIEHINIK